MARSVVHLTRETLRNMPKMVCNTAGRHDASVINQ